MHKLIYRYNLIGKKKNLYMICWMVFFFSVFDGLFAFMSPILMEQRGIDEIQIGLLLGSSSVAGLLADFLICRVLRKARYKRIFFIMLLIASAYPIVLWGASNITMFLVAMALWGIYFDLLTIGQLNFVSMDTKSNEHIPVYSVLRISIAMGSLIAVILCGILIQGQQSFIPYIGGAMLLISYLNYFGLTTKKQKVVNQHLTMKKSSVFRQLGVWRSSIANRGGLLLGIFFLNVIDSAFWQLSPSISENEGLPFLVRSFFMVPYQIAPLVIGIILSKFINNKRVDFIAHYSLILACLTLSSLLFVESFEYIAPINIITSLFLGFAWPTYWGSYSTAIEKNKRLQAELETLGDAFTNLGYIFGPILVGYLANSHGDIKTFGVIGLIGSVACALSLVRKKLNTDQNSA